VRTSRLDRVQAVDRDERRCRWRAAMLKVWAVGDVLVGVDPALSVCLLTPADATSVPDPFGLAKTLAIAEEFADEVALRTGLKALRMAG
jgi:hypothetical protein